MQQQNNNVEQIRNNNKKNFLKSTKNYQNDLLFETSIKTQFFPSTLHPFSNCKLNHSFNFFDNLKEMSTNFCFLMIQNLIKNFRFFTKVSLDTLKNLLVEHYLLFIKSVIQVQYYTKSSCLPP